MNIIKCEIIRRELIQEECIYLIRNILSRELHRLNSQHIEIFDNVQVGNIYSFVDEENHSVGKRFLNIIHPDFHLGNEINIKIEKTICIDAKDYFLLKTPYRKEITTYLKEWQSELKDLNFKVMGYKRGIPILKNIDNRNNKWKVGSQEFFKIISYGKIKDYKNDNQLDGIKVQIENDLTKDIKGSFLHREGVWTFDDIRCMIIGIDRDGIPKLKICDSRHPTFIVGDQYDFIIQSFRKKTLTSGSIISVIDLKGIDSLLYEVIQFPNQENRLKIGDSIKCKVVELGINVKLIQVEIGDSYFYTFEEIVGDAHRYQNYFQNFLNEENEYNIRLKNQYDSKSGFWVITYCNYIIPRLKKDFRKRKNIKELIEIINLNTILENWILQKGMLKSINDQNERKIAKKKIESILRRNSIELNILKKILLFKEDNLFKNVDQNELFETLYYYLLNKELEGIKVSHFTKFIMNLPHSGISEHDIHYISRITDLIRSFITKIKQKFDLNYFILTNNLQSYQKTEINIYINWLYVILKLNEISQNVLGTNLVLSEIYRYKFYLEESYDDKKSLLLNAFDVVSNVHENNIISIVFSAELQQIIIAKNNLKKFNYQKIEVLKDKSYKTIIKEKHYKGYKVKVDQIEGFLPNHNINDFKLKNYEPLTIEWETTIEMTHISNDFKYFICKQTPVTSPIYISQNRMGRKHFSEGEIAIVIVDHISDFGVFVKSDLGIGLIHIMEISDSYISKRKLYNLFKTGEKLTVYSFNSKDDKLNFSLKRLIGTPFEDAYNKIIERDFFESDFTEIIESKEILVELEKGFIFEQFALIQNDVLKKIKYVKFAKLFFSNTNNARSYLLNIYIEYFEALIKLDKLIEIYSFDNYEIFKKDIVNIKEKIQPQTLENFPESKNLVFFIDILNLFNNKDESSLEDLFNLLKKASHENNHLLKMVAKNALSNNLLISEIQDVELDNFTYKNLKRIREFITQGVLSVEETEEDRFQKELNQKRDYWRGIIGQDEGEKLEFKASLFIPVPNNEKIKIITRLKEKILSLTDEIQIGQIKNKIEQIENESKNIPNISKILIHSALKNICAFANTIGGTLLIGVGDDKEIYGLGSDYSRYSGNHRDEFGKDFDAKLKEYFGESFSSLHLAKREILPFPEGDVLIIEVKSSSEEVFLLKNEKGEKEENIYVRNLSSSEKLVGRELAKFIKSRKMA